MDVLSDVLKTVRLTGAIFFDCSAQAPWVAEQPPRELLLDKILPGAEHLIAFHVVTHGRAYANIIGDEAVALDAGEVIVFTQGDPHVMASSPGMRADPAAPDSLDKADGGQLPFVINYGAGRTEARFVCGFLACDSRPFNPLMENLPRAIKYREPEDGESGWIAQFIRLATRESSLKSAGGESVLARLSELMFIEVVRRYLQGLPAEQTGWLAGLRDPAVSKAISLIHETPAHEWTVEELARGAGLSRSVLAERFSLLVGMPPMQYLAKWRMQIAWGLLRRGTNIANVAAETGYGSEAAFSRAFKKVVGMSPSAWRRGVEVKEN